MEQSNSISKNAHVLHSFRHALHGLIGALDSERNLRIHWAASVLLCIFNLLIRPPMGPGCLGIAACCSVIAVEMINTAMERVVDLAVGQSWHPLAKAAKDMAAGAVLAIAVMSIVLGVYVVYSTRPWRMKLFTTAQLPEAIVSAAFLVLLLLWGALGYLNARKRREDEYLG